MADPRKDGQPSKKVLHPRKDGQPSKKVLDELRGVLNQRNRRNRRNPQAPPLPPPDVEVDQPLPADEQQGPAHNQSSGWLRWAVDTFANFVGSSTSKNPEEREVTV